MRLPAADIAWLDRYRRKYGLRGRGEVLRVAFNLLQDRMLEEEYRAAGEEWQASEDGALWDQTRGDGLGAVRRQPLDRQREG
ncbi:hypothetical protein [Deinococcus planocerae]|uniref:hypothetical protein n=1 Tax=Deinococcus planocerae TaxID=1737569 RepID=UPI001CA52BE7|nr:hypothetical protein [Deinococcus planocerae]